MSARFDVECLDAQVRLRAFEPTPDEVRAAAVQLSSYYNDEHNRAMLTNDNRHVGRGGDGPLHRVARTRGDRLFLLERDGVLVGDADFRHFDA
jgi:hypothetical protein